MPLPRLRRPPQRHALRVVLCGFCGLRHRAPGLLSAARHRVPSKAGPLWECRGAHQSPAAVPAGAKAPGIGSHSPQTLAIHLSVLPNPSLKRDPARQAAWASWRAGLCCTTPPKRLTARVALSSNVRRHKLLFARLQHAQEPDLAYECEAAAALSVSTRLLRLPQSLSQTVQRNGPSLP